MAERDRLQPGEPLAPARAAEADRHLVADELAATPDEDRWPPRETRALLLVATGRRTLDAAAVRGDRAAADDAVGAGRIAAPSLLLTVRQLPEVGVVSEKPAARVAVRSLEGPRRAQTGFRGAAGTGSGGKERIGFHRGRNAGAKLKIPLDGSK